MWAGTWCLVTVYSDCYWGIPRYFHCGVFSPQPQGFTYLFLLQEKKYILFYFLSGKTVLCISLFKSPHLKQFTNCIMSHIRMKWTVPKSFHKLKSSVLEGVTTAPKNSLNLVSCLGYLFKKSSVYIEQQSVVQEAWEDFNVFPSYWGF